MAKQVAEGNSSEDEYEDAAGSLPTKLFETTGYTPEVSKGLEDLERAVTLVITNNYVEAESILKDKAGKSFYHAVAHASVVFIQAALSFDRESIERSQVVTQQALDLCNKHRRTTSMWNTFSDMWYGKRLDGYTAVELHAEVFYAECSLLEALLTFLQDESMMSFIRAGLKIRSCYSMFKQCHNWIEEVTSSLSSQPLTSPIDKHFVSGIHLGVGVFNVVISLLPGRILKLLEFVGFSGDRTLGIELLTSGYHSNTCHSPLCSMALLAYYCVIAPYTGFGAYEDLTLPKDILTTQLTEFPDSGMLLFFSGRLALLQGNINEAIEKFLHSITQMSQWKKLHIVCYWELMCCYCCYGNWRAAAYYADLLYDKSRWSKATFLYQKAAFLLMAKRGEKEASSSKQSLPTATDAGGDPPFIDATDDEIREMMKKIPSLKQRIAGRSLPIEKFVINKAERYLQGESLPLCGLEMMFAWNKFDVLKKSPELAKIHLATAWEAVPAVLSQDKAGPDDFCVVHLMHGLCFWCVGRLEEAKGCLDSVVASSSGIQHDHYTAPAACWQLGVLLMEEKNYEAASKKLETARSAYKGYVLENRIHFRIHAALNAINKHKTQKQKSTIP